MAQYGLMIDYEYCSGCHSCEVACKNEKELPIGKWGIKLTEVGPFKKDAEKWEWNYVPVPTSFCDVCEERIEEGKEPSCVLHCLAKCMEYGPIEELAKKAAEKGSKVALYLP